MKYINQNGMIFSSLEEVTRNKILPYVGVVLRMLSQIDQSENVSQMFANCVPLKLPVYIATI